MVEENGVLARDEIQDCVMTLSAPRCQVRQRVDGDIEREHLQPLGSRWDRFPFECLELPPQVLVLLQHTEALRVKNGLV